MPGALPVPCQGLCRSPVGSSLRSVPLQRSRRAAHDLPGHACQERDPDLDDHRGHGRGRTTSASTIPGLRDTTAPAARDGRLPGRRASSSARLDRKGRPRVRPHPVPRHRGGPRRPCAGGLLREGGERRRPGHRRHEGDRGRDPRGRDGLPAPRVPLDRDLRGGLAVVIFVVLPTHATVGRDGLSSARCSPRRRVRRDAHRDRRQRPDRQRRPRGRRQGAAAGLPRRGGHGLHRRRSRPARHLARLPALRPDPQGRRRLPGRRDLRARWLLDRAVRPYRRRHLHQGGRRRRRPRRQGRGRHPRGRPAQPGHDRRQRR
jgi:hypothetical protein